MLLTVADRYRSYGNTGHGVGDGRRPTIWVIGRVKLDSTFPDNYDHAHKERFYWQRMSGTVCGNRRHTIVHLKPHVSNCSMRIKEKSLVLFKPGFHMICQNQRRSPAACHRQSPTVTNHMESQYIFLLFFAYVLGSRSQEFRS